MSDVLIYNNILMARDSYKFMVDMSSMPCSKQNVIGRNLFLVFSFFCLYFSYEVKSTPKSISSFVCSNKGVTLVEVAGSFSLVITWSFVLISVCICTSVSLADGGFLCFMLSGFRIPDLALAHLYLA